MCSLKTALLLGWLLQAQLASAYSWPSPQYEALETFLYEGQRGDDSNLASLVHPCRKRTGTGASIAAEWLRFAFHDMATHNVDDGSGGLDGSIVYELGRSENFGLGFNQTLTDFETFPNKYVSRADIIALGAVFATATCGGPLIPFRGGRVDTWTPGTTGTPEPQQDLDTLKESFRKQGFSNTEMIALTACGHTIGGIRSPDFPTLVPAGPDPTKPNIVDFDSTTQFDNKVVTEYLDGTTQNVLVVTQNTTMASDLRVFISDGNQTMRGLSDPNQFSTQCQSLLERMLNTVPHGVSLTDEITLIPTKVWGTQLTIERGQLVYKANLRLTQPISDKLNKNRTVTMFWCDKYGSSADCKGSTKSAPSSTLVQDDPNNSPVTQRMGLYFVHYKFVVPIQGTASISRFWFEVDEHNGTSATVYNNGGNFYVVPQDQVVFVPTMSTALFVSNGSYTQTYTNRNGEAFTKVYNMTVAVREGSNPSRVYASASDNAIHNFTYAVNTTFDFSRNTSIPSVGGYDFYSGTVSDSGFQTILDIHADAGGTTYTDDFRQTSFLDNTPFIEPSTVNSDAHPSSSSSSSSPSSFVASVPRVVGSGLLGLALILLPLHIL
ncbi:L-ascorbate oxidase [Macrolepiota fuliginosa MF-IS2]|uniref:Peroxidase n=1 Tax=Macrolepiota fuliginosa MF-IS2 TaxID=1400762 RepID=A0A9P5XEW8_9AGAR|nr:L-ascorbate oxidase [Macrolepiota fuliginosa MF-IS2]